MENVMENRRGLRVQTADGPAVFGTGRTFYWRIVDSFEIEEVRDYGGARTEAEARAAGEARLAEILHHQWSDWRD